MTELLIPAGNFDKLKVAILYGADAVYLAGDRFSLRSGSDNFSISELEEAVQFAHAHQCRVYVALNAFLLEQDFQELPEFVRFLDKIAVDAVICSDLGVIQTIKENSNLKIHLSTQASVLNCNHAKVWKDIGVKRIVLGREVSILEASKIKRITGLEIEIFVHGAMCMSYSGHCTISNYTAGRDSNRGGCIQSCRHQYVLEKGEQQIEKYIMSSKDLFGLDLVPLILEHKIDSMKVEGRMKSFLYVASVGRAYSQVLQNKNIQQWQDELKKLPHRDYTSGNLKEKAGANSIYNGDRSEYNHYKLAGMVLDYDCTTKTCYFQCLHKLTCLDSIEILETDHQVYTVDLSAMKNLKNETISVAQPSTIITFISDAPLKCYYVARYNALQHVQDSTVKHKEPVEIA